MDNVDSNIRKRVSQENPFKVPEGYFDSLTKRVMDNAIEHAIEERPKFSIFVKISVCAVAACVAGLVFFMIPTDDSVLVSNLTSETSEEMVVYDEDYQKDVMNYAMLDNDDVYAYLAGVNY